MDDHERREVRRVGAAVTGSPHGKQRPGMAGGIPMVQKKQTAGSSSSTRESSGNAGGLNPPTPLPGQGKRPQEANQDSTSRPAQKKLKFDEELIVHALLPNGTDIRFSTDVARIQSVNELLDLVRLKSTEQQEDTEGSPARTIVWGPKVWLTDDGGNILNAGLLMKAISSAKTSGSVRILVYDGEPNPCHKATNLFDITPEPEILGKLPQGYTLETALADQVDNALQAVWHIREDYPRIVSVTLEEDKITIFDTGQGMDASAENSIQFWGTVGGSMHRSVHHKAIGGEPPFLKPYLGKYGAGGVGAALHLGRSVTVWSKTEASKTVVSLNIEPKALVEKRGHDPRQRVWKTGGAFRAVTKLEKAMSPHGSFTKVEISKLKSQYCIPGNKAQYWKVERIRQLLKDIYFPYIQTDLESDKTDKEKGSSSKTVCHVTFQVNDEDLLGVQECETAIFNMHTCAGDPFFFDIHMSKPLDKWDTEEGRSTRSKSQIADEANARITCRYYPNQRGKESLETVLEELKKLSPNSLTFETMHRVTIRWLGRLLPEAKWPILPFMEVSPKKEQKLGVRRLWSKRVRAFIDTDAGFFPNQSKTQLETDQPFAVALKNTGLDDLSGTSAKGVHVSFTLGNSRSQLTVSQLTDAYMEWVKDMHSKFDEDCTFLDDPIYIFHHPNAKEELGVVNKQVILFHKHMKDAIAEYKVDQNNPLRIRVPKGTHGLKSDLFATVEFFFHDGDEDEHGEVKFLCRPLDVDDSDGCRVTRRGENTKFLLNKSLWFPASLLGTTKRLDPVTWRKKIEELSNKSPNRVEILKEEDIKKLEMGQVFPLDDSKLEAKFEAGYTLPTELLVVVRPKKGTGPSFKQGMIVTEPMSLMLTVRHCNCSSPCWKRRGTSVSGKSSSPQVKEDHGRVVSTINAQSTISKSGVKGLYMFNMGSADVNRLRMQGIYTFDISVETELYKNVRHSVSSIQIFPSRATAKWTLCRHAEDCAFTQHHNVQPCSTVIRLNERLQADLFIQKYDRYDNQQTFDKPLDLEVMVLTPKGLGLEMRSKVQATQVGRYKLQIKDLLFKSGLLEAVEPHYEGLLSVRFPENHNAYMSCRVLPGSVASFQVKDSQPVIPKGSLCFQEPLQPGEIIKKLTIQGLDRFGNIIEKGQKVHVQLEGFEFQDQSANAREVDDNGCLQLGGLLKVKCSYNSKGLITILSVNGMKLCSISFETVTRQLLATQVPLKSYVGRQVEGITIEIVDECGRPDKTVDGYMHSVTADWLKGVTCVFEDGQCTLPDFKLPEKPGTWKGKVYFSADRNLSVTLSMQLELASASSIGPARRSPGILTAQCGVPFVVPFSVYDDQHQPARLTESMKGMIRATLTSKELGEDGHPIFRYNHCECKDVKMARTGDIPGYEAHVILSGPVGTYVVTLRDEEYILKGQVETTINLEHGHVARLLAAQSDGAHAQSLSRPLTILEVKRDSAMPNLTVTLLDSEDNVCSSCEGKLLRMNVLDCAQWKVKTAKVVGGIGHFESSAVGLQVGSYEAFVELDSPPDDFYSLDEQVVPIKAQLTLRVSHGNYPLALKLLNPNTVSVSLTGEAIQYLPQMIVLVESADGLRLRCRPTVGVKIIPDSSQEYYGTFVENSVTQSGQVPLRDDDMPGRDAGDGSVGPVRYEFTEVCVPRQAGTYVMEFSVKGSDVPPQSGHLTVRHGPATKLDIIARKPGQEMSHLQVQLVDRYGNTCEDIYGVEVALDLQISKHFSQTPGFGQCFVNSKTTTVVKRGQGDFGTFELAKGTPAMYTLKVFPVDCNSNMTPAEAQIFVTRGNVDETIKEGFKESQSLGLGYQQCLKLITGGENMIQEVRAKIDSLKGNIGRLEEELRSEEARKDVVRKRQEAACDDNVLEAECRQPLRTVGAVEHDLRRCARNSAALALWEAQSGGNFLSSQSPDPLAKDILGLVVMLGRVESEALNRSLSAYMGVNVLLSIVVRTQRGADALEENDKYGNVDKTKGLHRFAEHRGVPLEGKFNILALTDVRPYSRNDKEPAVNSSHPQRLLNIDPPRLPGGEVPRGFLGHAVNLVHLRPEHIQVRVATRQRGEFGLRESLFFHVLGLLQVYDTRENMISAKEGLVWGFNSGAISLDGGLHRKNQLQERNRGSDRVTFSFSTLSPDERMMVSLVPPACYAFQRKAEMNLISAAIKTKLEELWTTKQRLADETDKLHKTQKTVRTAKTEEKRLTEQTYIFQKRIDELVRAANTIGRSGHCGTPGDSGSSQDSDSQRMRSFMM
ncbi:unnamed protein product [Calypogeia fissa]